MDLQTGRYKDLFILDLQAFKLLLLELFRKYAYQF